MATTLQKGHKAEDIASLYLEKKGFSKLESNKYYKVGELDLIFQDKDFIVFIEVKSLNIQSEFSIFETLTKSKKVRIRKSINTWIAKNNKFNTPWRFDFVGILYDGEKAIKVEHFEFVDLK